MAQHILTYKDNALLKNGELVSLTLNIDPTLENNTWETIAKAFKCGLAPSGWLGQTKEITSGTYNGYHLQLVDNTANRYERVDGNGYTKAVFQFLEVLPTKAKMNNTTTNNGGWASCYMRSDILPSVYADLPSDIQAIIKECKVLSGIGGGYNTTSSSNNKLFFPCEYEVLGYAHYSIGASEGSPQYTWYANPLSDKLKHLINSDINYSFWERSPYSSALFCTSGGYQYADTPNHYAPAFAI